MITSVRRYTTLIAFLGAVALVLSLFRLPADLTGVAALALVAIVAEWANVELLPGSRSRVSLTSVVALAAVLLFGVAGGALVYAIGGIVTALTTSFQRDAIEEGNRSSLLRRTSFNLGMYVSAITVAATVFHWLGGHTAPLTSRAILFPLLAAVATDHVVNVAILVGVIARQQGAPFAAIWREHFAWAAPIAVGGAAAGSLAIAVGYQSFGLPGLVVFVIPLLLVRYSYWLYVHHTRRLALLLRSANEELIASVNTIVQSRQQLAALAETRATGDDQFAIDFAHRSSGVQSALEAESSRLEQLHRSIADTIAGRQRDGSVGTAGEVPR